MFGPRMTPSGGPADQVGDGLAALGGQRRRPLAGRERAARVAQAGPVGGADGVDHAAPGPGFPRPRPGRRTRRPGPGRRPARQRHRAPSAAPSLRRVRARPDARSTACHGSSPTARLGPRTADLACPPACPTPGQQAPARRPPPGALVPASGAGRRDRRRPPPQPAAGAASPACQPAAGCPGRPGGSPCPAPGPGPRRAGATPRRPRPAIPPTVTSDVPVPVMRQIPDGRQAPRVRPGRAGERRDVLRPGRVGQRGQFRRVLPGQLAGQACPACAPVAISRASRLAGASSRYSWKSSATQRRWPARSDSPPLRAR